jgi:hypothetical protein
MIAALFLGLLPPLSGFCQEECTIAVVSGKATIDGRPLLWKNRDTNRTTNKVAYFTDGKYPYIGVTNAGILKQVWMGVNSAGFAIINSDTNDLDGAKRHREGYFMKTALMECATVREFEQLLLNSNSTGRKVKANFGIIDAEGGAAIFETGNHTFKKFDANDNGTAPMGFLVRSNFAITGKHTNRSQTRDSRAKSLPRYKRAKSLFEENLKNDAMNYQTLLRHIARDLVNDRTNPYPLPFEAREENNPTGYINTYNSINRYKTVSCAVFHGVAKGEPAELTTMWVILGEPICGVAVPLWAAAGGVPPALGKDRTSLLNTMIRKVEKKAYPNASLKKHLNTMALVNDEQNGILKELFPLEDVIFNLTDQRLSELRKDKQPSQNLLLFETQMVEKAIKGLNILLNEI